jgi:hypothetical protein
VPSPDSTVGNGRWFPISSGYLESQLTGPLAQLVEQGTFNPKVAGSIPARPILRRRSGTTRSRPLAGHPRSRRRSARVPRGRIIAVMLEWNADIEPVLRAIYDIASEPDFRRADSTESMLGLDESRVTSGQAGR